MSGRTLSCVLALSALVVALRGVGGAAEPRPPGGKPNILFIAVDDLRPALGCYGSKIAKTPGIDRLAAEGLLFERAYCQIAICGPSRASLMTGLRPNSVGVTENRTYFRDVRPDIVTLPQHFIRNGYDAMYIGKIYHGNMRDEGKSWNSKAASVDPYEERAVRGYQLPETKAFIRRRIAEVKKQNLPREQEWPLSCGPAYECADVPDNAYGDGYSAERAIATLRRFKDPASPRYSARPLFLGLGFHKPHLPFVAPKRYWDMYDPDDIVLAANRFSPKDAPSMGLHRSFELRVRHGVPKSGPISNDRKLIHAYLACASYVDAQIGKVLDELDRLKLREKTVIILWGDHGWHLGEHGVWGKATNYEIATRVPLILSAPGAKARGRKSRAIVELLDMYPTLCELAGIDVPVHAEGKSLVPLLGDPDATVKDAALSQFPCPALREWAAMPLSPAMRGTFFGPFVEDLEAQLKKENPDGWSRDLYENHLMGYALRTDRYRFVCWVDDRDREKIVATELYDHVSDPGENTNLAGRPEQAERVARLTAQLKKRW
jgi:iduronate 2-sulfatase